MIKDRGTMKWQGLMLPEHVQGLRKLMKEMAKVEKPTIDSQQYEEFEIIIGDAMAENSELAFVHWKDGRFETVVGRVHYIDTYKKRLHIVDCHEECLYLSLKMIVDVRWQKG